VNELKDQNALFEFFRSANPKDRPFVPLRPKIAGLPRQFADKAELLIPQQRDHDARETVAIRGDLV
jgi:hypothetical protein